MTIEFTLVLNSKGESKVTLPLYIESALTKKAEDYGLSIGDIIIKCLDEFVRIDSEQDQNQNSSISKDMNFEESLEYVIKKNHLALGNLAKR